MDAGFRKNVIPSEASAILDIRMLPDEDVDAFYGKLAGLIDDPQVTVVPEPIYRPAAPPSPIDNEMFQVLESVATRMYPDATTMPTMSTGATDMAQVRAKGVPAYGIGAIRSIEERNSGFGAHGDNERVSEEAAKQLVHHRYRSDKINSFYGNTTLQSFRISATDQPRALASSRPLSRRPTGDSRS
jgi:acetylornithine deacetylase/succinyl-diaminopimelate desuccinylase-like protein